MTRLPPASALLAMIAGYLVWSLCFVALYAVLSVGCALHLQLRPGILGIDPLTLLLAAAWLLHLAALAWLVLAAWRKHPRRPHANGTGPAFLPWVTLVLHLTALAATVWIGLPVLLLPPCA